MFSAIASIFRGVKDAFALEESETFEFKQKDPSAQKVPQQATVKQNSKNLKEEFGQAEHFEMHVAPIYNDKHIPLAQTVAHPTSGQTSITVSEREIMLENENHRLEARLHAVESELRQMKSSMRRIARELFRKELFED